MDQKVAYKGEAQLVRWADSNTQGPTITLRFPSSEDLEHFRGATVKKGDRAGQLYAVMIVEVGEGGSGDAAPPAPVNDNDKGQHGNYYTVLHKIGWFFNPAVWRAVGTDEQFLAWLRTQPCCASRLGVTGRIYECHGDVVAAHVRRIASGAGTGIKPQYSAVPMCDAHHRLQHERGESAFGGMEWFDKQRAAHLVNWIKSILYQKLNTDSLAKVHPAVFEDLINSIGIGHTLPRSNNA